MYVGKILLRSVYEGANQDVEQLLENANDDDWLSRVLNGIISPIEEIVISADSPKKDVPLGIYPEMRSNNPRLERDLSKLKVDFNARLAGWGYQVTHPDKNMKTPDLTIKQVNGIMDLNYVGMITIESAKINNSNVQPSNHYY